MKKFHIVIITALLAVTAAVAWWFEPTGWLATGVVALAMSFVMMYCAAKSILAISYRKRLYDEPGGRHIHTTPTPRLGGIAFAPIIFCTTILALTLHESFAPEHHLAIPDCLMWISALTFIHMIGIVDDLVGVRYYVKFSAQIIAALLVVASGFWINDMGGLFGIHALSAGVGIPLTVFFIVGIINAFNLIDGMDGLAAGICMIAFAIYGIHSFVAGKFFFSLVAFSALGTLMPFSYLNVHGLGRRRRKLFMGDTGSQTLGMAVSVLAVGQIMNNGTVLVAKDFILALSPLVVPVFDVAHVVLFRMLRGNHPFHPDMTHIHHRLMKLGSNQRKALALIVYLAAIFVAVNMLLVSYVSLTWILIIDIALWCAISGAMCLLARRKKAAKNEMCGNDIKTDEQIVKD